MDNPTSVLRSGDAGHALARRVLIVVTSDKRRGAELEALQLAEWLRRSGIDVELRCLSKSLADGELHIESLGRRRFDPVGLWRLRRLARERLVIAYGSSTLQASAASLLASTSRFIYRSIGNPSDWITGGIHRRVTGWFVRRSWRAVAIYPGAREGLIDLYRVEPSRVCVIPNARPARRPHILTKPDLERVRSSIGVAADARLVLWVGALDPAKRPHWALEVADICRDLIVCIVGTGPLQSELKRESELRNLSNVRLLGGRTDVSELMEASDVLLHTSSAEGVPGVLIEAAQLSLPFVALDVGGVEWAAKAMGWGVVLDADSDVERIAAAIESILAVGRLGSASTEAFEWPRVGAQWIDALLGCCSHDPLITGTVSQAE